MLADAARASHAAAAALFLLLAVALLGRWRSRPHAGALAAVCLVTALWALSVVFDTAQAAVETLRSGAWLALVLTIRGGAGRRLPAIAVAATLLGAVSLAAVAPIIAIVARLCLSMLGLALVEQLYRGAPQQERWAIKFACIGIGAIFAYDLYLYSDAALFQSISEDIRAARGMANALAAPLLALSLMRNARWSGQVALSRALMLRSATLVGSAIYLLAMALAGYALRLIGGDWGRVMQLAFLCGACMVLAGVLFSGAMRARLKVWIGKHFYTARFDYRHEWLRFTRVMSEDGPALFERTIYAMAGLVESPSGALWLRRGASFEPVANWNMPMPAHALACDAPLTRFLEQRQWVIDLPACRDTPQALRESGVPDWLLALPDAWLVVPLVLHGRLAGMVVLARPRAPVGLNWEVIDVLKIAGSQAASYLAYRESLDQLLVARQFESFNRMSTFIVHDLKNLVQQFSLLLANAERHRDNPAFQADMLGTLEHSTQKMKDLLQRLARGEAAEPFEPLPLDSLLVRVVGAKALAQPRPHLRVAAGPLVVMAQRERLERVVGHLVQNAVEASSADGSVTVSLVREGRNARVDVSDSGHGMSADFMRERLFRPFDSTKTAGMGIGVFESREYVRELGGQLIVSSVAGQGSTFSMLLPLWTTKEKTDGQTEAVGHRG